MDIDFKVTVILPASGNGERFGKYPPKQFTEILGEPLIKYTISNFHRLQWVEEIIVIINRNFLESTRQMVEESHMTKVVVVEGCHTRHRSIYAGIKAARKSCEGGVIIIQDGVRLFADEDLVKQIAVAAKNHGAAGVTRSLVSTVIAGDSGNFLTESLNRSLYKASEMPQGFKYDVIKSAYEQASAEDFDYGTECLLLAMKYAGVRAKLVEGPDNLWKVTYRKDVYSAEAMLKESHLKAIVSLSEGCGHIFPNVYDELKARLVAKRIAVQPKEERDVSLCNSYVFFNKIFDVNIVQTNSKSICDKLQNLPCVQISPCIIHVFTKTDLDVSDLIRQYQDVFRSIEKGVHYCIIFEVGGDAKKLCEMIVDLLWNRTRSLSGQVFVVK